MKRAIITALAVLAGWWGGANLASAQGLMPGFGASPFFPLGGGLQRSHPFGPIQMQPVNPQIAEMQQTLSRINLDGSLRSPLDPTGINALGGLQTGHATTFFNTGHYYPTTPYGGSGNTGTSLNSGLANNPQGTGFGGYNPALYGGGGFGAFRPFGAGSFGTGGTGIR